VPGVHLIALVLAVVTISILVELLRRRQLRQKYALIWIVVGVAVAVVAIFPGTFNRIARDMGVVNPADLLVVLAALFLLLVCVHLSWEIGRLEDRNRRLAEALTLRRNDVDRLAQKSGGRAGPEGHQQSPAGAEGHQQSPAGPEGLQESPPAQPDEVSDPGDEAGGRRQPAPRASQTRSGPS